MTALFLSVEPESPYDVPKIEARLYYAGLYGPSGRGPKLVYSLLKFPRVINLEKSAAIIVWDTVREEVVKLLDKNSIQLTSVDLIRFRWTKENDGQQDEEKDDDDDDDDDGEEDEEKDDDGEEDEEDEGDLNYDDIAPIEPVLYGTVYTTPVTIWVGVKPDSTTGEQAHHAAMDILRLLESHHVTDVEVAFRESEVKLFAGPALFAPVPDEDCLKDVIDNLSTALSLPIAGMKTPMQGTLGFYFGVGDDLYAVTARHVLFQDNDPNVEYNYVSGPKKEVVVMGAPVFADYLTSLQKTIDTLYRTVTYLEDRIEIFTKLAAGDDPCAAKSVEGLPRVKQQLTEVQAKIKDYKAYSLKVKKQWSEPKDRVIGYVVWSPPISVNTPPYSYTKDICVIKLDKKKFRRFKGNVLSLGPEISLGDFNQLMYDRFDAPPKFVYPQDGIFKLRGILSKEQICTPNNMTPEGNPIRRVIKRGFTTLTTVGGLTGFDSHTRRYFVTGEVNSIEAVIIPHNNSSGLFSKKGDSGSIIIDAMGRFVALLTSGTAEPLTDSSDITYGTPMHWLWPVILAKFPDANLYWDNMDALA